MASLSASPHTSDFDKENSQSQPIGDKDSNVARDNEAPSKQDARSMERRRSRSRSRSRDHYGDNRRRSRSPHRSRSPRRHSHRHDDRRRDRYYENDRYYGDDDRRYQDHRHRRQHHSQEPSRRGDYRRGNEDFGHYGEDRRGNRNRIDAGPRRHRHQPEYHIVDTPKDGKLGELKDDPRGEDPTRRITKKASSRGAGRNTESFDPASTLVRPDLRIHVGSGDIPKYNKPLKHDDVVIVPSLFGAEDDWSLYYKLVEEMREVQAKGDVKGSEWISWHEGAHLICKNPKGSPTFTKIIDRLCEYFNIRKESTGTRFNWYRDSSDWKPFHHDSAAFNPQRAKNQNITVGVSFGATRELAFIRAEPLQNEDKVRVYFPQTNNGVFSFGRDANILWKHGINALPPAEQDGKGRISIILWGLAQDAIEEEGSPPLLGSDGQGPHANKNNHHNNNKRRRRSGGHRGGGGQGRPNKSSRQNDDSGRRNHNDDRRGS